MPKKTPEPYTRHIPRPKSWSPSDERRGQMTDLLMDDLTMRVFCDCSVLPQGSDYGVAATFVGGGRVIVRSMKVRPPTAPVKPTMGELHAVMYAVQQASSIVHSTKLRPTDVIVYSDLADIAYMLGLEEHQEFGETVRGITLAQEAFRKKWPSIGLIIEHLVKSERRFNPYYRAAHNAARVVVGAKS